MNALLPRTLHSKDLRELTRGERLLLFFFVAFPGNHTAAVVSSYIGAVTGRTAVTATAVEQLFRTLEDEKVFEKGVAARGVFGTAYRLAANFSLRALRQLGADASKLGWWPTPAVLLNGHAGDWLGAELAAAVRNYVDPKQVWQIAETLKALLVGGPCAIGGVPQGARYPLASVHWSAVSHLCRLLAPLEPLPAEDLSGAGADQLLAVLFEFGFLSGHDVRFALLAARKVFAQDKLRVSVSSLCAYCALAVWTGRRDFLTNAVSLLSRGSPAERFAALCRDVFSGDFPEAEKAFASGADSFRGVFSTDVSTPVWALGLALALREGAPMVRVSKYAKELKREVADLLNWHPAGRSALHDVDRLRTALVRRLMGACSPMWQPSAVDESADVLAKAKALFLAGYSTLAALHVAEVRRMKPELNGLDAFAQMLDEGGAVPLVKRVAEEPKWKAALRALNDRLPDGRDKPVEQVLNGTIGWVLTWTPAGRGGEDCFLCARLLPV